MLRDWLILIDVKFNSPLMKKYQVLVFIFFLNFQIKDPSATWFVSIKILSTLRLSQTIVNAVVAYQWFYMCMPKMNAIADVSEREITLIANDSWNIIFCTHILIAVYIKSGICAICKINCYTKTTKSCHILIYQKKIIWTHILSQPVSFQHYIY